MATVRQVVGQRLRELRGQRSQQQIAKRMEVLGHPLDRSAIARIENDDRRVTVDELLVLAAALGTSPLSLLTPNGTVEVGRIPLDADTMRRWLSGEEPEAVLREEVRQEARNFTRQARGSVEEEWADELTQELLANPDLGSLLQSAVMEPPKRRVFLIHLLMSTAAYQLTERGQATREDEQKGEQR